MGMNKIIIALIGLVLSSPVIAGNVEIVKAKAEKGPSGWRFDVTLKHDDTGWEHYADAWRVLTPDGKELGTRTLYHPHENEQPFTRSLRNVKIGADINHVFIEAHDKVHGWAKQRYRIDLK
jgi:hypothetical protein